MPPFVRQPTSLLVDHSQTKEGLLEMRNRKKHHYLLLLFPVFSCIACGRIQQNGVVTPGPDGNLQPTLSSIQANVFSPSCGISPCHVAGGIAPFRLDKANQSFVKLVGVQSLHNPNKSRVAAGDPGNSYILDIIQGNGVNGAVMPPGGNDLLSANKVQQLNDWITAGAQNN